MTTEERVAKFPATDRFKPIDIIGVPHPYVIGPKHVGWASDHWSGRLGIEAIEDGEKHGIHCAMRGCTLTYDQHEHALLIEVKSEGKQLKDIEGLQEYLLSIKDQTEKDHLAGFAFVEGK